MRSPSQTFADLIKENDFDKALQCLSHHGVETTQAALWVAMAVWAGRPGEARLLDAVFASDIPGATWADSFLRRLALPGKEHDVVLGRILDVADAQVLAQRQAVHHAAYHGKAFVFDALQEKLEAGGAWTGWDNDLQGLGTPLYLAMREFQEHSIVALLQRGCDEDQVLSKGTKGADGTRSALDAAKAGGKYRTELDEHMGQIKRKVTLEKVARTAGRLLERGAESLKKNLRM